MVHNEGMENTAKIILPWPPSELSPNKRQHWANLAGARKVYRAACATQARLQGVGKMAASRLHLSLTFYPPTRRSYDLDNLLARCKSGLDGLADVIGVDDSRWSLAIQKADKTGGYVEVEITEKHT